jgi:DNA-binding LacI/PurR family transcriptional regulator
VTVRTKRQPNLRPFERVAAHVREILREGSLAPGDSLPSERELAERLGVSHLTVRKSLLPLVEEGLIERQVGRGTFVADASKRSAQSHGLRDIVLALHENRTTMPVMSYALQGVRKALDPDRFSLEVLGIGDDGCSPAFIDRLRRRRPHGLLYHGYLGADGISALRGLRLPFVSLGVVVGQPGVPHVSLDFDGLIQQAVQEAYRFGHRSLGFVTWGFVGESPPILPDNPAVPSYQAMCRRFNLLDSASRISVLPGVNRPDASLVDTSEIFSSGAPMPTCLIVNDDVMAAAVVRDLESRGLRVPDDVSVIAMIDATPHAHRIPLTACDLATDYASMYESAGSMLLELLDGRSPDPIERLHSCTLHLRASLGSPRVA